jgi:hypothetical protein
MVWKLSRQRCRLQAAQSVTRSVPVHPLWLHPCRDYFYRSAPCEFKTGEVIVGADDYVRRPGVFVVLRSSLLTYMCFKPSGCGEFLYTLL